MTQINLIAKDEKQKIILKHLTPLISDVLAEKINNGVRITKDNKSLISKKDLDTFMEYLTEQAKNKIPEKERHGEQSVGMEGEDILNIAIHYFEEDSIHGKLFNLDGTEYVPPKPVVKPTTPTVPYKPPTPQPKPQLSIFDMVSEAAESAKTITPTQTIIPEQPKPEQKKGSPMYQHYSSVKAQYKDCIIFYRLGDFYEMFEDDAKTAANILDLTLTGRDFGLDERVPMTGIPFHAADNYIQKLVAAGYKVAICEPLEGQSERTVNRVITQAPETKQLVDVETGEIIQEELNLDETEELPTVSKLLEGIEIPDDQDEPAELAEAAKPNDDFDIEQERQKLKAFDRNAIIILADLLGNIFTLE